MPERTIEAEIDGKSRTIVADIPDGSTPEQVQSAVREYIKANPIPEDKKPEPGFWSKLGSQAKDFAGTITSDIASIPGAVNQAFYHPIDTIRGIGESQGGEYEASKEAFKKGQIGEGIRRGIGYAIPFAGPQLSQAGTEAESGQYGKSLAHTLELTPAPEAAMKGLASLGRRALGPASKATARSIYEAELRPSAKISLAQRKELVERGLKGKLPIEEKSLTRLQPEIEANKQAIDTLTKDPASPYSGRSVPVADVLMPVDKFITRVARVDPAQAKLLMKKRATWASSLGGGTDTTVAAAQQLKEDFYAVINSGAYADAAEPGTLTAGRKLAARGMKKAIEDAIPEEPIRAINHAIENDIRLKDAITSAIKKHPSWINDWGVFVLGAGAGEAVSGHLLGGGATAIAALTRMAARNPRIMSRLAIALDRSGMLALGPAVRSTVTAGRLAEVGTGQRETAERPD